MPFLLPVLWIVGAGATGGAVWALGSTTDKVTRSAVILGGGYLAYKLVTRKKGK